MSHSGDASQPQAPAGLSTEVVPPTKKKRYSAAYKLRVIDEADGYTGPGELGAFLRREGLYFSTLTDFRKQKARGDFDTQRAATASKEKQAPEAPARQGVSCRRTRGTPPTSRTRTRHCLARAAKKVSEILGLTLSPSE